MTKMAPEIGRLLNGLKELDHMLATDALDQLAYQGGSLRGKELDFFTSKVLGPVVDIAAKSPEWVESTTCDEIRKKAAEVLLLAPERSVPALLAEALGDDFNRASGALATLFEMEYQATADDSTRWTEQNEIDTTEAAKRLLRHEDIYISHLAHLFVAKDSIPELGGCRD